MAWVKCDAHSPTISEGAGGASACGLAPPYGFMEQAERQEASKQTAAEEASSRGAIVAPTWAVLTLTLLAIAAPWICALVGVSPSREMGLFVYLAHWSAVGGVIGFVLSRGHRGATVGAILGAILAVLLMC